MVLRFLQIQESRAKICQISGIDAKRLLVLNVGLKTGFLVVGLELKSKSHMFEISAHGLKRVKPTNSNGRELKLGNRQCKWKHPKLWLFCI